jgi:hypothetical protein
MIALTREDAETLLRQFVCVDPASPQQVDYEAIRAAVLLVAERSDYQILGICADTAEQGLRSLRAYLTALGYETIPEIPAIPGIVYIKYNPNMGRAYMEPYAGAHRGVLVSCQSAYDDGINETFGHLPLDLFS